MRKGPPALRCARKFQPLALANRADGTHGAAPPPAYSAPGFLASAYARTVRNARIESSDAAVAPVEVTRCPEGTAEAQQVATRAYYAPIVEARAGAVVAEYEESPPEDESE